MKAIRIIILLLLVLCSTLAAFRLITGSWNVPAMMNAGYDVFIGNVSLSEDEIILEPAIPNSAVGVKKYVYRFEENALYSVYRRNDEACAKRPDL